MHVPKRGDRFIHARYLADDAKPPYDTDDKFRIHVVTKVELIGQGTVVYHATWPERLGRWYFILDDVDQSVRRWLD